MVVKLIVWSHTRLAAIARMHRALLELTIEGVATSRDFHLRVMEDAEFRSGDISIQWLERRLASLLSVQPPREAVVRAAIAAALLAERERSGPQRARGAAEVPAVDSTTSPWLQAARLDAIQ